MEAGKTALLKPLRDNKRLDNEAEGAEDAELELVFCGFNEDEVVIEGILNGVEL